MKLLDITEFEYRELDAISQSDLKTILKSPLHFKNRKQLVKDTKETRFGTAFHMAVLEPARFKELYVTEPTHMPSGEKINKRKKADKEYLEAFALDNADRVIIEEEDVENLTGMLTSLTSNPMVNSLLVGGTPEPCIEFKYGNHTCKSRLDYFHSNHPIFGSTVVELKTTKDASEVEFNREIYNRGYAFQSAFYQIATGAERVIVIAIEKTFPYAVGVYDMSSWIEVGKKQVEKAFDRLDECLATNTWPGYTKTIEQLLPPSWVIGKEGEIYE